MKQPVIDYRDFRLSRINEPAFSHLKLLIAWPIYFAAYFLTENLIPAESCHVIWCPLDDMIPFCEVFLIPYVGWYFLIAGSLLSWQLRLPDILDSVKQLGHMVRDSFRLLRAGRENR